MWTATDATKSSMAAWWSGSEGKGRYTTGNGHGDAQHTSDLDPLRSGLETFSIHEHVSHPHGVNLRDASTGEMLWSKSSPDVGRGLAADIDPLLPPAFSFGLCLPPPYRHRGFRWAGGADRLSRLDHFLKHTQFLPHGQGRELLPPR